MSVADNLSTETLVTLYQDFRDQANVIALQLEKRGLTGEYLRGGSNEWKPLDPTTRPTQFRFR